MEICVTMDFIEDIHHEIVKRLGVIDAHLTFGSTCRKYHDLWSPVIVRSLGTEYPSEETIVLFMDAYRGGDDDEQSYKQHLLLLFRYLRLSERFAKCITRYIIAEDELTKGLARYGWGHEEIIEVFGMKITHPHFQTILENVYSTFG